MLSPYFGGMIAFVKDAEVSLERTPKDKISVDERMYNYNDLWILAYIFIIIHNIQVV